jgi:hypothetical protein
VLALAEPIVLNTLGATALEDIDVTGAGDTPPPVVGIVDPVTVARFFVKFLSHSSHPRKGFLASGKALK